MEGDRKHGYKQEKQLACLEILSYTDVIFINAVLKLGAEF